MTQDGRRAAGKEGPGSPDAAHTGQGAPTDEAHQDAGDGTLTGSVPAGLTADELREQAERGKGDEGGTG